jgi:VanZ family protein
VPQDTQHGYIVWERTTIISWLAMSHRLRKLPQYFVLAAVLGTLVSPFPDSLHKETWKPLFDMAHLPAFGLLALWVLIRFDALGLRYLTALAFLVAVGMAVAVELVQPFVGRSGNPADALAGIAGVVIAVSGWHIWIRKHSRHLRTLHALLGLSLAGAVLWPSLLQIGAFWWQARSFPVLGDFESHLEHRIWQPYPRSADPLNDCPGGATHASRSLAVRTVPGMWSGIRYQANDTDWTGYERLVFDIYLPVNGPRLALRIDDDGDTTEFKSRFNQRLDLVSGWNHIAIPLVGVVAGPVDRSLNLTAVRQVLIFAGPSEDREGRFCLDHVRLE